MTDRHSSPVHRVSANDARGSSPGRQPPARWDFSEIALQPGDIVACWSRDWVGRGITWATASPLAPRGLRLGPSHVAIVCEHDDEPLWVESTTLCERPCRIAERPRRGMQAHDPADRLADVQNAGGRLVRYTPAPIFRLSTTESQLLSRILLRHFLAARCPYDLVGAALSGWRLPRQLRRLLGADLEEVFCSELVAAVLMRLGRLSLADPAVFSPARLLRRLVRDGVYRPAERLG